jgi:uncharacterized SAM-binding protein YcdF (DUF218 family)
MLFYATKVISVFLFPLGLSVVLLIALAVIGRQQKAVLVLSVAVLVLLLVCGTPMVSRVLLATLEDQYPPVPIERLPDAQAIVVLGGTLRAPAAQGGHAQLTAASERILHGWRLYRAGKAPVILCSGGSLTGRGAPESEFMTDLLREWGIPADALMAETRSRNTAENARFSWEMLSRKGWVRILLVTSGTHMPRAAALFRKTGFEVIPAAADYGGSASWLFVWMPDAEALSDSSRAIKEWLGLAFCRLGGSC